MTLIEVFTDPSVLTDKSPDDIGDLIELARHQGWQIGTLRRGSQTGKGLVLREFADGMLTGRIIQ